MSYLLFKQFLWRMKEKYIIRDFHPLIFFYVFAFLLLVSCVFLAVRLFTKWYLVGHVPEMTAMACMFTAISGLQLLLFGMWLDMENNRHLNTRSSIKPYGERKGHGVSQHSPRIDSAGAARKREESASQL